MQITTQTTYKEFLLAVEIFHLGENDLEQIFNKVKDRPLKEEFSVNFDSLVFGKLCQLQSMKTGADLFIQSFWILLEMGEDQIMKEKAVDCLRFVWHVKNELERVTKLFNAIQHTPTAEEVMAGIDKLSHGFFGTADWYARRMGITDHEQVFQTNWMRIYQAMKIDFDNSQFERKYRKVIEQKSKQK